MTPAINPATTARTDPREGSEQTAGSEAARVSGHGVVQDVLGEVLRWIEPEEPRSAVAPAKRPVPRGCLLLLAKLRAAFRCLRETANQHDSQLFRTFTY